LPAGLRVTVGTIVGLVAAGTLAKKSWASTLTSKMKIRSHQIEDRHGFRQRQRIRCLTHDLDFGDILAITHAPGPSVIQARVDDPVSTRLSRQLPKTPFI